MHRPHPGGPSALFSVFIRHDPEFPLRRPQTGVLRNGTIFQCRLLKIRKENIPALDFAGMRADPPGCLGSETKLENMQFAVSLSVSRLREVGTPGRMPNAEWVEWARVRSRRSGSSGHARGGWRRVGWTGGSTVALRAAANTGAAGALGGSRRPRDACRATAGGACSARGVGVRWRRAVARSARSC